MSGVHIDASEVNRLALDLSDAPHRLQRKAPKVMASSARKVADVMRKDASGHRHLKQLPGFVSTSRLDSLGLSHEIGFDKRGQGNLANFAAYGSSNNAPIMDLGHSLRVVTPFMLSQLGAAAEDSVLEGAE